MKLNFEPALNRLDLLAPPVAKTIKSWSWNVSVNEIQVAEIDPKFMGGIDLCQYYEVPEDKGANCVIVEGIRGDNKTMAACLVPVNCKKADFNRVVRKQLNARRVSLAPLDYVLKETNMEYGSITVVWLPSSWQILVDPRVVSVDRVIIGAGLQKSKLSLPGKALLDLPNVTVVEGLCKII